MNIVIGSDHRGFKLKQYLMNVMPHVRWHDVGSFDEQRCDFPAYAEQVAQAVAHNKFPRGILICGTGIGMAIAANRVPRVYAALCWNDEIARRSAQHEGANVLVLPADFITDEIAVTMVTSWMTTPFLGGRYQDRLDQIDQ